MSVDLDAIREYIRENRRQLPGVAVDFLDSLADEVKMLRAAMLNYAIHHDECCVEMLNNGPKRGCICGLDAVFATIPETLE